VEIRHNTSLLEEAIAHIVRRATIPTLKAEAEALNKKSRAQAHRRLATGAAIALAAIGIGFGVYFANRPWVESPATADATSPVVVPPSTPPPPATPAPTIPKSEPPENGASQPEPPPPDTQNFEIFNNRTVTLLGQPWPLTAGHHFKDAKDVPPGRWQSAWCYTTANVDGVKITVDLVQRDSPSANPIAPVASEKTIQQAGLQDEGVLALALQCPWLDKKHFNVTDFIPPTGRKNPFTTSSEPAVSIVGDVLIYDGEIGVQFTDILKGHTFTKLSINSPGGAIAPALEAGEWLRESGKAVEARDSCLSACVFVLAGGTERHETANARVGVHRFFSLTETDSKAATESTQEVADRILRYLENMGISSELWHAMEQVPSDDIRYLDPPTLLSWKVLTAEKPPADATAFVRAAGQDAMGNDLSKNGTRVKDVDACEQSCRDNVECHAFTFNTLNNVCFLKDRVDVVVFDPHAVMGYRKSGDITPRPPVGLIRHDKMQLPGKPYKTLENLDSGECVAVCLKDDNCNGYNFETTKSFSSTQKSCSLLRQNDGPPFTNDNVSSGQRSPAVDVVSGFYAALSRGDGEAAQGFLVPDKRGHGNFDPAAMTKFYGSLAERLVLKKKVQTSANEVHVQYHYAGAGGACEGAANLTLRQIGSDLLIDSINPAGC
jgi:hypothetical protein